jgi:hypothetical protein
MKKIPAFLGITALLSAVLSGSTQLFESTQQALTGWQVSGTEPSSLTARSGLTLPAGAQLSRSFAPGVVTVHLISQPFFGSTPADCPSLEVGPASLAFVRDNDEGELVLIVGETTQAALPAPMLLGEDGRSAQPLDLALSYDSACGLVTVNVPGQPVLSVSGASSRSAVEVAIEAGTKTDWILGSFDVAVKTPDSSSAPDNAADSSAGGKRDPSATGKSSDAPASASSAPVASAGHLATASEGTTPKLATQPPAPAAARASLEIFTPPSVRLQPAQTPPGKTEAVGPASAK